jgi:hypothetical protein
VYVDVAGWHLYLRDMTAAPGLKMHSALATQFGPQVWWLRVHLARSTCICTRFCSAAGLGCIALPAAASSTLGLQGPHHLQQLSLVCLDAGQEWVEGVRCRGSAQEGASQAGGWQDTGMLVSTGCCSLVPMQCISVAGTPKRHQAWLACALVCP